MHDGMVLCTAGFGDLDIYLQGNIGQQYLLCYYWMVATLTTNGQVGDMTPKSMLEVSTEFQQYLLACVPQSLCICCCIAAGQHSYAS